MGVLQAICANPFSYTVERQQIQSTSLLNRIWHYKDKAFYERNIISIADYVTGVLKYLPRGSPRESEDISGLFLLGKFFKIAKEYCPHNESVKKCKRCHGR